MLRIHYLFARVREEDYNFMSMQQFTPLFSWHVSINVSHMFEIHMYITFYVFLDKDN